MITCKSITLEEIVVSEDILNLPYKEKIKLIDNYFKNEWQGKTVSYQFFEENKLVHINKKTRQHIAHRDKLTKEKEHKAKLNILTAGKGKELWENVEYVNYEKEKKAQQNSTHNFTVQWHYFTKDILFNGTMYQVLVNVRENKLNDFFIHSISLKQKKKR